MATTNETLTFAQAGAAFNEVTRLLEGGLWQNAVEEGGQGLGSAGQAVTDLQAVQAAIQSGITNGQFTGHDTRQCTKHRRKPRPGNCCRHRIRQWRWFIRKRRRS